MRFYWAGIVTLMLCMGQSCSSVGSLLSSVTDTSTTTDTSTDTSTDSNLGIPQGVYSGTHTTEFALDNLSDALPAQTSTSSANSTLFFDSSGRLLRADGKPLAVGDTQYTDTQIGRLYETVTAINRATQVYQYSTEAVLAMDGQDLTWNFSGSGLYTYRYTGGHVLYDGSLDMVSDTAGGTSYRATWTVDATLVP